MARAGCQGPIGWGALVSRQENPHAYKIESVRGNAVAGLALEDCDEHLSVYRFGLLLRH